MGYKIKKINCDVMKFSPEILKNQPLKFKCHTHIYITFIATYLENKSNSIYFSD
jgi:hypothetical protein